MTSVRELFHLLALLLCLVASFAEQPKSTVRSSHQRHQLAGSSSSVGVSTSVVSNSHPITASKVTKLTSSPSSERKRHKPWLLNNFNAVVRNVQDECLDIFDALVYAESNEERVDELKDIFDRHKVTLVGGVAAVLVTKNMLAKSASYHGKNALEQMRKAEAAKWGTRLK